MAFFSSGRLVPAPLSCLALLATITCVRGALAQASDERRASSATDAPGDRERVHHVEALAALALTPSGESDPAACAAGPCPQSVGDGFTPTSGEGLGLRVGYRFRPIAYAELGASAEASFFEGFQTYAVPLMAYGRVPLRGGGGVTLGFGGGVARALGVGDAQQTDAFLRGELGAVLPVGGAWSVQVLAQASRGVSTLARTTSEPYERGPLLWASLALGPRYSF